MEFEIHPDGAKGARQALQKKEPEDYSSGSSRY